MKIRKNLLNKFAMKIRKNSPEILVVAGAVGTVAAAVWACKQTRKYDDVVMPEVKKIETLHKVAEEEERQCTVKELVPAYGEVALTTMKLYAGPVILGTLSLGTMLASNNILRKRNAALAAAYVTLDDTFKKYRQNIVDKFGTEADRDAYYSIKEVTEKNPETGKKETVKVSEAKDGDLICWFCKKGLDEESEGSVYYENDIEHNIFFLRGLQAVLNETLKHKHKLFLNEARKALGLKEVVSGQSLGWIYDEDDPDFCKTVIDLGVFEDRIFRPETETRGNDILISFNVQGNILELMK